MFTAWQQCRAFNIKAGDIYNENFRLKSQVRWGKLGKIANYPLGKGLVSIWLYYVWILMKVAERQYHCFPLNKLLFILTIQGKMELLFNTSIYSTHRWNSWCKILEKALNFKCANAYYGLCWYMSSVLFSTKHSSILKWYHAYNFFLQKVRERGTSGDNVQRSLCLRRLRSIVHETGKLRRFLQQPDTLVCWLGFHWKASCDSVLTSGMHSRTNKRKFYSVHVMKAHVAPKYCSIHSATPCSRWMTVVSFTLWSLYPE